jgi:ABC-type uncharacterized transport system fused permease/ATPase subunit
MNIFKSIFHLEASTTISVTVAVISYLLTVVYASYVLTKEKDSLLGHVILVPIASFVFSIAIFVFVKLYGAVIIFSIVIFISALLMFATKYLTQRLTGKKESPSFRG